MKMAFWQRLAVLTLLGWGISSFSNSGQAAQFEHQEIEQSKFIILAAPGGDIGYKLLILEQLNDSRPCWTETGSNPSNVEPLLLRFDFTGVCNRLVDSNGFSVRTAGQDQGLQYSLRVLKQGEELVLVAASVSERDAQIQIGRTYGVPSGFSRIVLDPGWRLTRRAFNGRAVGHVYLTYDQPIDVLLAESRRDTTFASRSPSMSAPSMSAPRPNPQPDVIPVPSLPPAGASPEPAPEPAPLPSLSTRPVTPAPLPAPLPATPQTGSAPNLSSILPPPPPTSSPTAPIPILPDSTRVTPERPDPNVTTLPSLPPAPSIENSTDSETDSEANSEANSETNSEAETTTGEATRSPEPRSSVTPAPSPTPVRPPIGVPRASTSGGAVLRPRALRREEPTEPAPLPQSSSLTNRPPATDATDSTQAERPIEPADTTIAQAGTYQVVVVADSAEVQDKVRALAPNAFLTTINGQVVMQVGMFRERTEADRLQQRLSLQGLPTAVIPVR